MSRISWRIRPTPAVSELVSRSRTIRPPSGRSSKTCAEVYWSTPITISPRACIAAKPVSGWAPASGDRRLVPLHALAAEATASRRHLIGILLVLVTDTRRRLTDRAYAAGDSPAARHAVER